MIVELNSNLVKSQRLTKDDIELVQLRYRQLFDLFKDAAREDDDLALKHIGEEIQNAEFRLQEAWKFPLDANFHRYWYRAPKCTCPVLDNDERFGTKWHITSTYCPLHSAGDEKKEEKNEQ